MTRFESRLALAAIGLALAWPTTALGQAQPPPSGKPGARGRPAPTAATAEPAPGPSRFRLVLNFAGTLGTVSYGDVRTPTEYAEQATIRSSYEAGSGFGPDVALQVSVYRGLGVLVGYSYVSRDVTGTVEVSRPHPLYLNRPRTASAELSGFAYSEGAVHVDLAYARASGGWDFALFAGVTFFQLEADLLGDPGYDESYPYDELTITSTPSRSFPDSPTGFNVGGRLDYRFGSSRRFGAGVQLRYSGATASLQLGSDAAAPASVDVGGLSVAAGVRVYF